MYWLLEVAMSYTPLGLHDLKGIFNQSEATASEYFPCFTFFSFPNRLNPTQTFSEHLDAHQGYLGDSRLSDADHLQVSTLCNYFTGFPLGTVLGDCPTTSGMVG